MASFSADMKKLFNAFVKTNSQSNFSNNEKKIMDDNKSIFDINGDGKFNQTDIDMFVKGDVDGDGKVSSDEFNFISKYKDAFAAAMSKNTNKNYSIKKYNTGMILTETNKNGEVTHETKYDKGDNYIVQYIYKDGVKTSSTKTENDGTKINYTYDTKGNIINAIRYWNDGAITNYTYNNGIKQKAIKTTTTGDTITYSYDSKGSLSDAIKIEKDGTRTEYKYIDGEKAIAVKYTYDKNKNITSQKTYAYDSNGKAIAESKISYTYDNSNKLTKSTNYTYINGEAVKTATNEYTYKSDGEYNEITTKSYNKKGNVTSTVVNNYTINSCAKPCVSASTKGLVIYFSNNKQLILNNGETAKITGHEITIMKNGKNYTYSSLGTLLSPKGSKKAPIVKETTLNIDDTKTQNIKDANGNIIKKIEKDKNGKILVVSEYNYDSKGVKTSAKRQEYDGNNVFKVAVYTYHDDGKTIKTKDIISNNGETKKFEYNKDGKVLKEIQSSSYGARYENTYTYKEDGSKIVYRTDYTQNNKKRAENEITWNSKGKKTGSKRKVYNPTTEKQNRFCNYVCDENGVVLREEVTRYDANGNKTGNYIIKLKQRSDGSYAIVK